MTRRPDPGPATRPGGHRRPPVVLALALLGVPFLLNLTLHGVAGGRGGAGVLALGLACMWGLAAGAHLWTRRLGLDIGFRAPGRRGWVVAVGVGVLLMLAVPVLSMLGSAILPGTGGFGSRGPLWIVVAGVVTAAVTEEVLFRGAGITLLESAGVPTWTAAGISLAGFTLAHVGSWPLGHVLVVALPLGAALTWCYTRFRNLPVVMVAHAIVDAPLVVFALTG